MSSKGRAEIIVKGRSPSKPTNRGRRRKKNKRQDIAPEIMIEVAPPKAVVQKRQPNKVVNRYDTDKLSPKQLKYFETLVYPEQFCSRPPDIVSLPTTLYRSVREFKLGVNVDNTPDSGRFSFAVQPKLGGIDALDHYQVAIVNNVNGWPTDFSIPASYLTESTGTDPRVDPNVPVLTYPSIGNIAYKTTSYAGDTTHFNINYPPVLVQNSNFNLKADFVPYNGTSAPLTLLNGAQIKSAGQVLYLLTLPCGAYNISSMLEDLSNFTSGSGWAYAFGFVLLNKACTQVRGAWYRGHGASWGAYEEGLCSSSPNSTLFINNEHHGAIYNAQQGLISFFDINVRFDDDMAFGFITSCSSTTSSDINVTFSIQPTMNKVFNTSSDCGNVQMLRPIAMSCLLTNVAPPLFSGGNIVAYSAPASTIKENYFAKPSINGPLQAWESLAVNNKGSLTHDGVYTDGAYAFYQPYNTNDLLLRSPTQNNAFSFPGIIMSGQFAPGIQQGYVEIGRIRIITIFEYTTNNPLFEAESNAGTTNDLEAVTNFATSCPHCTANATHLKAVTNFVKSAASGLVKHSGSIKKGIDVASGIAKMMI